ncbi:UBC-like protein [Aspergillus ellipticus CBS 707.79]|uniref:Ubiquitin-conjugating enzyme E2 2 n=1 Tax=Aspergillus ellipticus CBS 707.79 TaxID=1448320 RepID=A0A319DIA5_9EURO|nr:UBC-like protein [Aspergillus ellipticus CBS 707.79]
MQLFEAVITLGTEVGLPDVFVTLLECERCSQTNHDATTACVSQPAEAPPLYLTRRILSELLDAIKDEPDSPKCDFISFAPATQSAISHLVQIHIPSSYSAQPPECRFVTQVWHPNIGDDGEICLNILREEWGKVLSVRTVFLSIAEAGRMWLENREQFVELARDWTRRYATSA